MTRCGNSEYRCAVGGTTARQQDAGRRGPGQAAPGTSTGTGAAAAFGLLAAALLLSQLGYRFEQYDQLQYLLLPYRSIYRDFLPGDWFTWHTAHYHVVFSWLVRGLHALTGAHGFAAGMFGAHLLTLWALGCSIFRLAAETRFGTEHDAGGLGARARAWLGAGLCVVVSALVRVQGVGGATLNHGYLVPADMALPPLLLGMAAWLRGKHSAAGAWLGLSGLLHANYAVLGPLVLGTAELAALWARAARGERGAALRRPVVAMVGGYLPLALPSLYLIARSFLGADPDPGAVDIIFKQRSPHHYTLAAMSPADLWWPLLLFAGGLPAWLGLRAAGAPVPGGGGAAVDGSRVRRTAWLGVGLLVVLGLGLLGSLAGSGTLVRLFCWRMSVPALCLCLLAIAATLADGLPRGRRARLAAPLAALLATAPFIRSDLALVAGFGLPPLWFGLPVVLAVGLGALVQPVGAPARADGGRRAIATALALLVAAWAVAALYQPELRHMRSGLLRDAKRTGPRLGEIDLAPAPGRSKLRKLHTHARLHTPPGSAFLVPPHMVEFRLAARRAVYVDFKAAPMRGDEALQWQARMFAAMGHDDYPAAGYALRYAAGRAYAERPLAELVALARAEGLDYVVALGDRSAAARLGLRALVVDVEHSGPFPKPTRWTLYKLPRD